MNTLDDPNATQKLQEQSTSAKRAPNLTGERASIRGYLEFVPLRLATIRRDAVADVGSNFRTVSPLSIFPYSPFKAAAQATAPLATGGAARHIIRVENGQRVAAWQNTSTKHRATLWDYAGKTLITQRAHHNSDPVTLVCFPLMVQVSPSNTVGHLTVRQHSQPSNAVDKLTLHAFTPGHASNSTGCTGEKVCGSLRSDRHRSPPWARRTHQNKALSNAHVQCTCSRIIDRSRRLPTV